ncbi:MAG: hypothetical protein ACRCS9_07005 [Hyphomicrobium sp.]
MVCDDGKCHYDTISQEPMPVAETVPELYSGLFTLAEYTQLVANSELSDSHRQAVLQLVSPKGAKTKTLVCPVAIKPDEPEWMYALVIFPDNPTYPAVALVDVKVQTLKRWKLVRNDDWQPEGENIAEYTEHARRAYE